MQAIFSTPWQDVLKKKWDKLILLGLVLLIALTVVQRSHLTRGITPVTTCALLGFVLGCLLSATRFSNGFAILYTLILAHFTALQATFRFLPRLPAGFSFWQWLDLLNLHFFTALQTVFSALGDHFTAGHPLPDRVIQLLIGLFAGLACSWLGWQTFKQKRSFAGVLPLGIGTVILMQITGQNVNLLFLLIIFVVILTCSTSAERIKAQWDQESLPYPWDFGLDWVSSMFVLALLVGGFSFFFYLAASREGWQKIDDFIDRLRPQPAQVISTQDDDSSDRIQHNDVDASTADLLVRFTPPPTLTTSVLSVKLSDPPPLPPEVSRETGPTYYLRGEIYGEYTGNSWLPAPVEDSVPPQVDSQAPTPGRYVLEQEYTILASQWGFLYAINQPVAGSDSLTFLQVGDEPSFLLQSESDQYRVVSWAARLSADQLAAAGTEYPSEVLSAYTQLPETLPKRIKALAQTITEGSESSFEQSLLIQNYLRSNYSYSLEITPPPAGQDVVEYFLFEEKQGFCSYYASSMVVMLRSLGVPARVAAGYVTGGYNYYENAYIIPASNAHAWVEVYFPGFGWVEFEPTTARAAPNYGPLVGESTALEESPARTGPTALFSWKNGLPGLLLGLALVSVICLYAIYRHKTSLQATSATRQYARVRSFLSRLGFSAPASLTPLEYADMVTPRLADWPWLQDLLRASTRLYVFEVYSPTPPDAAQQVELRRKWQDSGPQRLKLRASHFLHRAFQSERED
ncbi:hypothetical protein ADN00_06095 [Ornatilinea apprima]|uniref:Transglutaminase-like domain-containing protein n=1 Tax=Ornatilinea apprima TaxID=1134406 RepID=A0A0P6Y0F0_9CHLR|nr:transglutaminase domain-containing protein [Ornatilinea apprima]KPL78795.1 hypothetical protein ADN00_06095 [Ornatilinea apprima]